MLNAPSGNGGREGERTAGPQCLGWNLAPDPESVGTEACQGRPTERSWFAEKLGEPLRGLLRPHEEYL